MGSHEGDWTSAPCTGDDWSRLMMFNEKWWCELLMRMVRNLSKRVTLWGSFGTLGGSRRLCCGFHAGLFPAHKIALELGELPSPKWRKTKSTKGPSKANRTNAGQWQDLPKPWLSHQLRNVQDLSAVDMVKMNGPKKIIDTLTWSLATGQP